MYRVLRKDIPPSTERVSSTIQELSLNLKENNGLLSALIIKIMRVPSLGNNKHLVSIFDVSDIQNQGLMHIQTLF